MSQTYRRKSVVIEAFQMTQAHRDDRTTWPGWLQSAWIKDPKAEGALFIAVPVAAGLVPFESTGTMFVNTHRGAADVAIDDWIIRGVDGELYPCKPGIFARTYEPNVDADGCA